ncbi:IS66 family insertion sequence element accessory protein TnpB [Caballeronia sordidicola]|uniref:Uncharacterized protein n=2 Tax=Caballeronia sordidicola TaxID=196367 RepID=A0A242M568_CABSO|nr:IS66 family insertion sequence element accessory protein TnpB [Caballeronia sordidicola]AME28451.1 hypothetical protein AXG89_32340 [Burkholderia sp. PAMC 26561]OTP66339.1 hypothetical protein PAMC26577_37780 [Caballeronia sordidicola]
MLIASDVRAYVCLDPVDMRKAIDGLSYLVEPLLAQRPASGNLLSSLRATAPKGSDFGANQQSMRLRAAEESGRKKS